MGPLGGKVTLITGGSRGVGLATALTLARLGAATALVGRDEAALSTACRQVEAAGGRALGLATDVAEAIAYILQQPGRAWTEELSLWPR